MTLPTSRTLIGFALAILALTAPRAALAGPPLLCHPFEIGAARSLPWDGRAGWFQGRPDYQLGHLVKDTEEILARATPVIVRMETLRRAAIYASADEAVAAALLQRLSDRVHAEGQDDTLAYLDLAYLVGAFNQISSLDRMAEFKGRAAYLRPLVVNLDAYAFVRKSLLARPEDPSLQFAAAVIAADSNRAAYEEHARLARAGIASDVLLARNIGHIAN